MVLPQSTTKQRAWRFFKPWTGMALLFPCLLVMNGAYDYWRASRVASWPTTPGMVLISEVVEANCPKLNRHFTVELYYSYSVGDRQYTSHKLGVADFGCFPSQEAAAEEIAPYPKGKTVKVFYQPENPENALLQPHGSDSSGRLWHDAGIIFLIEMLLGGVVFLIHERRKTYDHTRESH